MEGLFEQNVAGILSTIFLHLDPGSLHSSRQVCRRWNSFILGEVWGRKAARLRLLHQLTTNWRLGVMHTQTVHLAQVLPCGQSTHLEVLMSSKYGVVFDPYQKRRKIQLTECQHKPEQATHSTQPLEAGHHQQKFTRQVSSVNLAVIDLATNDFWPEKVRINCCVNSSCGSSSSSNSSSSSSSICGGGEKLLSGFCWEEFLVLDDGCQARVLNLATRKEAAVLSLAGADFTLTSHGRLVMLGPAHTNFNLTRLTIVDLRLFGGRAGGDCGRDAPPRHTVIRLPCADILTAMFDGRYLLLKTIAKRDRTWIYDTRTLRIVHGDLLAGDYGTEQDFLYPLVANIANHAILTVVNLKTEATLESYIHEDSVYNLASRASTDSSPVEVGLKNQARFTGEFLVVTKYLKYARDYSNCGVWVSLYQVSDLCRGLVSPAVLQLQQSGHLFHSFAATRTRLATVAASGPAGGQEVKILNFWH